MGLLCAGTWLNRVDFKGGSHFAAFSIFFMIAFTGFIAVQPATIEALS
jgi:hypothetical protein